MRLLAVQRIGLNPLLAERNAARPGQGRDTIAAGIKVLHKGLPRHRRQGLAIALKLRAGDDHAGRRRSRCRARNSIGNAVERGNLGNRAGIKTGYRVNRSRQRVGQRLIEHVVGRLAGRVTGAAGLVENRDLEPA